MHNVRNLYNVQLVNLRTRRPHAELFVPPEGVNSNTAPHPKVPHAPPYIPP